jgi:hypothetical protein
MRAVMIDRPEARPQADPSADELINSVQSGSGKLMGMAGTEQN